MKRTDNTIWDAYFPFSASVEGVVHFSFMMMCSTV